MSEVRKFVPPEVFEGKRKLKDAENKGYELAFKHITGKRKVPEKEGVLIPIDFRNEQGV
jgi:hypothetical protein